MKDDFDDIDDLDSMFDEDLEEGPSRGMTSKASGAFLDEFKGNDVGGDVKTLISGALPSIVGTSTSDAALSAASDFKDMIEESTDAIKKTSRPLLKTLSKAVGKDTFTGGIIGKLQGFVGDRDSYSGGESEADKLNREISGSVLEALGNQRGGDSKRELIKEHMAHQRSATTDQKLAELVALARDSSEHGAIVQRGFYAKTLELQYRHLSVAKDTKNILRLGFDSLTKLNMTVVKNTGLPDFLKLRSSEALAERFRSSIIDSIQTSVTQDGSLLERGMSSLKRGVKNITDNVGSAFELGAEGSESMGIGEESDGMSANPATMAGGMGADGLKSWIGKKIGIEVRSTQAGRNIDDELSSIVSDPSQWFGDKADGVNNRQGKGVLNWFSKMTRGNDDSYSDTMIERESLNRAGLYTERSDKTLNTIIPTYLAEILNEMKILNGDDVTGVSTFDHGSNSLVGDSSATASFLNQTKHSVVSSDLPKKYIQIVKNLIESSGIDISKEEMVDITNALYDYSRKGKAMTASAFRKNDLVGNFKDPITAEKFISIVEGYSKGTDGVYDVDKVNYISENLNSMKDLSNSDDSDKINDMIKSGKSRVLKKMGVLKFDESLQRDVVDKDKYNAIRKELISGVVSDEFDNMDTYYSYDPSNREIEDGFITTFGKKVLKISMGDVAKKITDVDIKKYTTMLAVAYKKHGLNSIERSEKKLRVMLGSYLRIDFRSNKIGGKAVFWGRVAHLYKEPKYKTMIDDFFKKETPSKYSKDAKLIQSFIFDKVMKINASNDVDGIKAFMSSSKEQVAKFYDDNKDVTLEEFIDNSTDSIKDNLSKVSGYLKNTTTEEKVTDAKSTADDLKTKANGLGDKILATDTGKGLKDIIIDPVSGLAKRVKKSAGSELEHIKKDWGDKRVDKQTDYGSNFIGPLPEDTNRAGKALRSIVDRNTAKVGSTIHDGLQLKNDLLSSANDKLKRDSRLNVVNDVQKTLVDIYGGITKLVTKEDDKKEVLDDKEISEKEYRDKEDDRLREKAKKLEEKDILDNRERKRLLQLKSRQDEKDKRERTLDKDGDGDKDGGREDELQKRGALQRMKEGGIIDLAFGKRGGEKKGGLLGMLSGLMSAPFKAIGLLTNVLKSTVGSVVTAGAVIAGAGLAIGGAVKLVGTVGKGLISAVKFLPALIRNLGSAAKFMARGVDQIISGGRITRSGGRLWNKVKGVASAAMQHKGKAAIGALVVGAGGLVYNSVTGEEVSDDQTSVESEDLYDPNEEITSAVPVDDIVDTTNSSNVMSTTSATMVAATTVVGLKASAKEIRDKRRVWQVTSRVANPNMALAPTASAVRVEVVNGSKIIRLGNLVKGVFKPTTILKSIPILGLILAGGFAVQRIMTGDINGAMLELASGVSASIPIIGLPLSIGIQGVLYVRDKNSNTIVRDENGNPFREFWKDVKKATNDVISTVGGVAKSTYKYVFGDDTSTSTNTLKNVSVEVSDPVVSKPPVQSTSTVDRSGDVKLKVPGISGVPTNTLTNVPVNENTDDDIVMVGGKTNRSTPTSGKVLSDFEAGIAYVIRQVESNNDYSKVKNLGDGAGISFGAYQLTEKNGSLKTFLREYIKQKPQGVTKAKSYDQLLSKSKYNGNRTTFKNWLNKIGGSKESVAAQDLTFKKLYYEPGLSMAKGSGFKSPEVVVHIIDAKHNGGVHKVIKYIEEDSLVGAESARFKYWKSLKTKWKRFGRGWTNRIIKIRKFIKSHMYGGIPIPEAEFRTNDHSMEPETEDSVGTKIGEKVGAAIKSLLTMFGIDMSGDGNSVPTRTSSTVSSSGSIITSDSKVDKAKGITAKDTVGAKVDKKAMGTSLFSNLGQRVENIGEIQKSTMNGGNITNIVVHCTASPTGGAFGVHKIHALHSKKWKGIGYHFVINNDGSIDYGRNYNRVGSHAQGHNTSTIGVVYVGGTKPDGKTNDFDAASPAIMESLVNLTHHLCKLHGLDTKKIIGHSEIPGVTKTCPNLTMSRVRHANIGTTVEDEKSAIDEVLSGTVEEPTTKTVDDPKSVGGNGDNYTGGLFDSVPTVKIDKPNNTSVFKSLVTDIGSGKKSRTNLTLDAATETVIVIEDDESETETIGGVDVIKTSPNVKRVDNIITDNTVKRNDSVTILGSPQPIADEGSPFRSNNSSYLKVFSSMDSKLGQQLEVQNKILVELVGGNVTTTDNEDVPIAKSNIQPNVSKRSGKKEFEFKVDTTPVVDISRAATMSSR